MNTRMAEATVIWFLQEADSDACQMKAAAWNFSDESAGGGGGSRGASGPPAGMLPDYASASRGRLRRAWYAFQSLTLDEQRVLRERYNARGRNVATVPGFGEWSSVGCSLPQVRKRADHMRTTPHESLRDMAKRAKDATLLEQCKALVNAALDRFGAELDAFDQESDRMRLVGQDRMQALREGRA